MISSILKLTLRQYIRKIAVFVLILLLFVTVCIALVTVALMHGYTALVQGGAEPIYVWLAALFILALVFVAIKRDIKRAKLKQQLVVQKTINEYHHLTSDATRGVIMAFIEGFNQPQKQQPTNTPQPQKGDDYV